MRQKPNYGIDSPAIVVSLCVLGTCGLILGTVFPHLLGRSLRWICLFSGGYFLLGAIGMLFYSKAGKYRMREGLLDMIPWRGDEIDLDVGCGRGLLVVGAARRLSSGKAVGVDVWLRGALSDNRAVVVPENAMLEGVADRVEVKHGDARRLPFVDAGFDVVISNFVLHEMKQRSDRELMVREMVRVLKPGGRVALVDFIFYRRVCAASAKLRPRECQPHAGRIFVLLDFRHPQLRRSADLPGCGNEGLTRILGQLCALLHKARCIIHADSLWHQFPIAKGE
jgi:arsenite methyltransferase